MRAIASIVTALLVLLGAGCSKPPSALIVRALASTNVVFHAYSRESITLSQHSADAVKQIVKRFNDPAHVEVRKDILPAYSGFFILGDVQFGWVGSLLCLKDPEAQRYYVVQDGGLGKMSEVLMRAWGPPPAHDLSNEQWQEVVAALESKK